MVGESSSEMVTLTPAADADDDKDNKTLVTIPSSSVTSVISTNNLLFEILLHLPVLSLMLFKSVSKQWFNIITSPRFITRRRKLPKIDPPFGLITSRIDMNRLQYNFESFDTRIPSKKRIGGFIVPLEAALRGRVWILQSCNGLLLCYTHNKFELCVYNPSINMLASIPTKLDASNDLVKMAFDPRKSPHYKIVQVNDMFGSKSSIELQTYCSETGKWSAFGDTSRLATFEGFEEGVYWNGAIYWLNPFDLFKPMTLYFKLDIQSEEPVLTELELPETFDEKSFFRAKLFESCGCLLLVGMDRDHPFQLNVYEMMHGSIKYVVNLDDIVMPLCTSSETLRSLRDIVVSCIVLGEREEDSLMLIELEGKAVQYNLVSKAVHTLDDLVSLGWHPKYTIFNVFQCIPSFALV